MNRFFAFRLLAGWIVTSRPVRPMPSSSQSATGNLNGRYHVFSSKWKLYSMTRCKVILQMLLGMLYVVPLGGLPAYAGPVTVIARTFRADATAYTSSLLFGVQESVPSGGPGQPDADANSELNESLSDPSFAASAKASARSSVSVDANDLGGSVVASARVEATASLAVLGVPWTNGVDTVASGVASANGLATYNSIDPIQLFVIGMQNIQVFGGSSKGSTVVGEFSVGGSIYAQQSATNLTGAASNEKSGFVHWSFGSLPGTKDGPLKFSGPPPSPSPLATSEGSQTSSVFFTGYPIGIEGVGLESPLYAVTPSSGAIEYAAIGSPFATFLAPDSVLPFHIQFGEEFLLVSPGQTIDFLQYSPTGVERFVVNLGSQPQSFGVTFLSGGDVNLFATTMVPEPSGLILAAFGLIGFAAWGWRRGKH